MENKTKVLINFQTTAEDAALIDALTNKDGINNRSAWVRFQLRKVIDARKAEVAAVVNPVIRAQA